MSDRIKGIEVLLATDMKQEEADAVMTAISMVRGVLSVRPSVATPDDWMARQRVGLDLYKRIHRTLDAFVAGEKSETYT